MTDGRLTALNPVDSQVYPVACNDKGELLLEANQASGNLDVQGDLTVSGTGTFVNGSAEIQGQGFFVGTGFVSYKMAASSYAIHDDDVNWQYSVYYNGTTHIGGSITTVDPSQDTPNIALNADGSASFLGNITCGDYPSPSSHISGASLLASINPKAASVSSCGVAIYADGSNNGTVVVRNTAGDSQISLNSSGSATFAKNISVGDFADTSTYIRAISANTAAGQFRSTCFNSSLSNAILFEGDRLNGSGGYDSKFRVFSDGSATFASGVTSNYAGKGIVQTAASSAHGVMVKDASNNINIKLNWDGSAVFVGQVYAPNITFRMSEQAVAEMPAPLIDDGFAANREIDLLSELIKMKAEIKNLNAFMQKSIQESSET